MASASSQGWHLPGWGGEPQLSRCGWLKPWLCPAEPKQHPRGIRAAHRGEDRGVRPGHHRAVQRAHDPGDAAGGAAGGEAGRGGWAGAGATWSRSCARTCDPQTTHPPWARAPVAHSAPASPASAFRPFKKLRREGVLAGELKSEPLPTSPSPPHPGRAPSLLRGEGFLMRPQERGRVPTRPGGPPHPHSHARARSLGTRPKHLPLSTR